MTAVVVGLLPTPADRLLVVAGTGVRPAPIVWCLVGLAALVGLVRAFVDTGHARSIGKELVIYGEQPGRITMLLLEDPIGF